MKIVLFGTLLLTLVGCTTLNSGLEKWSSLNNSKREYEVKAAWIRRTTEKDNLGFRKINRMTPVLAGDLVIQGNGLDGIVAYSRDNGQERWRLPIENGAEPSATLIRDRLFVGASDGNFYSIEASTGTVQWTFNTKSENLAAPLLEDGIVYFLAGNSVFYALDAATGRQIWLHSRQDTSQFSIRGGSQAALNNGILYVGFSDGSVVALNAKTGSSLWEVQLNRNKRFRDIDATPVVEGNQLYVAGYDDKLYCLSVDKGEVLWRIEGGGYSGVTVVGDKLIYPTTNGEVQALNKASGDKLWSYKLKDGIATQVRTYKGVLVFGESQGSLRFLDANAGTEVGSFEPGRGILSSPQVDEKAGRVYFISGEANLYAIDAGWIRTPYF
ncbi:PQQ-binding-like beta-propeller repeat protein [Bdellovibrio bacteriovorus]|uniref:Putative lipoprotein n=1 Tax=Bdellovibrio bacteriovorus (strain ATCC 15356 / DSM 50701 / NCIMB 9529 / HD100) TaxID=264462 RepID=Q6MLH9_BDEBA|nr:PQQ-binding-like beta-propeller repeat protein [Bdellovibrio bacteriovorus]AHZ84524.1 lipoprotein [Bdellovibrio bacteriovorus]BEV68413.1 Outer membrane protein assembly factor BamB [Bdellovibrio bacteriovorus]CAE79878.1 putative lipoprotein [Bdellovibrio bacteriovorus HD100]